MDGKDTEVLFEEVNQARQNVVEAAHAVTSAENRLETLKTLKKQRKAGATKPAFENAEKALADALKRHEELVQVQALKEAALAVAQQVLAVAPCSQSDMSPPDMTNTCSPTIPLLRVHLPRPTSPHNPDTSRPSITSNPPIPPGEMDIDDCEVPAPAPTPPVIPDSVVSMGMSNDINMHDNAENEKSLPDLQEEFCELLELSEKRLMGNSSAYKEHVSVLDGYEATAASHSTVLEEANCSMGQAHDALERAEKQSKEYLNSIQADCRSSALRDILQLTRDRMTTKGVGVVEAGRWKELFHLAEDELREVDEQALFSFRLGVPNVEPPPKKTREPPTAKKGKDRKIEKVDDGDKKPTEALAARERWMEMSPEEQEKLQVAAEAAIDRYLAKGTAVDPSLKRKIREIVELAPRAGTTSRELSLHILEHAYQICHHHGRYRTVDSFAKHDTIISIEGVGYRKDYSRHAAEGHLDCGCSVELALFEFFWFKTWSVGSSHPNVTIRENLKCDTIPPHLRSFFAEAYKFIGMVTLDDLFALKWGAEDCHNRLRLLQISWMTEYLQLQGVSVLGFRGGQEYEGDAGVPVA